MLIMEYQELQESDVCELKMNRLTSKSSLVGWSDDKEAQLSQRLSDDSIGSPSASAFNTGSPHSTSSPTAINSVLARRVSTLSVSQHSPASRSPSRGVIDSP